MKRNWELIRAILVAAENKEAGGSLFSNEIRGYGMSDVVEHMEMLNDAGYSTGTRCSHETAVLYRLTMQGHDLLDTIQSDGVWERIKETAKSKGMELTIDAVKQLAAYVVDKILAG